MHTLHCFGSAHETRDSDHAISTAGKKSPSLCRDFHPLDRDVDIEDPGVNYLRAPRRSFSDHANMAVGGTIITESSGPMKKSSNS